MPLTGEAKKKYQRDYMKRKRSNTGSNKEGGSNGDVTPEELADAELREVVRFTPIPLSEADKALLEPLAAALEKGGANADVTPTVRPEVTDVTTDTTTDADVQATPTITTMTVTTKPDNIVEYYNEYLQMEREAKTKGVMPKKRIGHGLPFGKDHQIRGKLR